MPESTTSKGKSAEHARLRLRFPSASGADCATTARRARREPHVGARSRHRHHSKIPILPNSATCSGPETCSSSTTAASSQPVSMRTALSSANVNDRPAKLKLCSPSPPAKISGTPWSVPAAKSQSASVSSFPLPQAKFFSKLKSLSAASSASAFFALRLRQISSQSSIASATCPCRPTSAATTPSKTASATRRFSLTIEVQSPPQPQACTSRPTCSIRSLSKESKSPNSRSTSVSALLRPSALTGSTKSNSTANATQSRPVAANSINSAARSARRIVAVGTTVVRTLEAAALQAKGRELEPHSGETDIFISPGFRFRLVSALLTNFHLPQSSLLMLVSAFAGREPVLAAYRHAVEQKYRFFSYGDCMFIR